MVLMSALSSSECVLREGKEPVRVLREIDLSINEAESWGITARTAYEIRLLLEIIGNIRPYEGGKCVLVQRGMMRKKRVIQPHIFYIGNTDMLYDNMNTLEFLMFATAHVRKDRISMQEELFEFLIDIGLGELSLTGLRWLSSEEKALVALIAAAYSNSRIIIFNVPDAVFDERLRDAIGKTAELITRQGKALIIGTLDHALIQTACSHTAFIADGRLIYRGTAERLRMEFDTVALIIRDPDIGALKEHLANILTEYVLQEKDGVLLIKAVGEKGETQHIYRQIAKAGRMPQDIRIHEKNVHNAYEELVEQHDLPEQLF